MATEAADENLHYQTLVGVCRRSALIFRERTKQVPIEQAMMETQLYEELWQEYMNQASGRQVYRDADFSQWPFIEAHLTNHHFTGCNFHDTLWSVSSMKNGSCTESDFSGARFFIWSNENTTFDRCDFRKSFFFWFDPTKGSYRGCDFSGATLSSSHSFFQEKPGVAWADFTGAKMNGCRLNLNKEKNPEHNIPEKDLRSVVRKIFSADQIAAMNIDYGYGGCFIATAACGQHSREVRILRKYRDDVLTKNLVGRSFIRWYYRISPPIARRIEQSPVYRSLVMTYIVHPAVRWIQRRAVREDEMEG